MKDATRKRIEEALVLKAHVHFTNAPESYDYGYTVNLGSTGYVLAKGMNAGSPIRAIATACNRLVFQNQVDRYLSGMYLVFPDEAALTENLDLIAQEAQ